MKCEVPVMCVWTLHEGRASSTGWEALEQCFAETVSEWLFQHTQGSFVNDALMCTIASCNWAEKLGVAGLVEVCRDSNGREKRWPHWSTRARRSATAVEPSRRRKGRPSWSSSHSSTSSTDVHWLKISGWWPSPCHTNASIHRQLQDPVRKSMQALYTRAW